MRISPVLRTACEGFGLVLTRLVQFRCSVCGIVGFFGDTLSRNVEELATATNLLVHRGPDDGRFWQEPPFAFGHRRLSIIDVDLGRQPMADVTGRYVITFNGEIYNFVELRRELE